MNTSSIFLYKKTCTDVSIRAKIKFLLDLVVTALRRELLFSGEAVFGM